MNRQRRGTRVDLEVDLHGLRIDAALRKAQSLLSRSDLRGGTVIRFIHGRSNGGEDSIREQLLRALAGPWAGRVRDAYREGLNDGATLVVLEDR